MVLTVVITITLSSAKLTANLTAIEITLSGMTLVLNAIVVVFDIANSGGIDSNCALRDDGGP